MKPLTYLLLLSFIAACQRPAFKERWLKETAPASFIARFETSKGNFDAEFVREWSPLAVDRLFAQIKHGFYDHSLFYRVRPNYVAQFGADDSVRIKKWNQNKVIDEPVSKSNERGAISFAREGKDSRNNDLFINLVNNSPRLDTIVSGGVKGFPAVGKVIRGMEVADSLYSGYSDNIFNKYELLLHNRHEFLKAFPKLDSINHVFILKEKRT